MFYQIFIGTFILLKTSAYNGLLPGISPAAFQILID